MRWGLAGAGFGVFFPVLAGGLRVAQGGLDGAAQAFLYDPLLWIVCTAPLFLGGFASVGGARQDRVAQLAADLELLVEQNTARAVASLRRTASDLSDDARRLDPALMAVHGALESTTAQTREVSRSAAGVSGAVVAAVGRLDVVDAAMRDIASAAARATATAAEAVELSRRTRDGVIALARATSEIDHIVDMIRSIAVQTDILALNATIEAARAGTRGAGFAVVATEVKRLAARASTATSEIASKVDRIRLGTVDAVAIITETARVVEGIASLQATIAAAVDEQTAAAKELSGSLSEAGYAATTIADHIADVVTQTEHTASGVAEFRAATRTVREVAARMVDTAASFQRHA